jgi:thioester reductase-like protein
MGIKVVLTGATGMIGMGVLLECLEDVSLKMRSRLVIECP